jgi:tetratricopeptide (TPR) repeat protein
VLLVAALTPRPKRKTKRKAAPVDLEPSLVAAPVMAVAPAPAAVVVEPEPKPEPRPEPVAIPIVAAEHAPAPPPVETFEDLRACLVAQSRDEAWSPAAQTLNRLLRMAGDDREKALSRRDLGDFARGQGRLDEAAEAYEEAVSYARAVRSAGPQGDFAADDLLASALSGVGDVAEMEGRLNDALSAFEEALALRRSHGGREAADPNARRALSVSLERLADLREDRGHRMRALDLYRESYDVAARLAAADPARFGADLASTRARLAELEAKVAG